MSKLTIPASGELILNGTHPVKVFTPGDTLEAPVVAEHAGVLVPSDKLAEMQADIERYRMALATMLAEDNGGTRSWQEIARDALRPVAFTKAPTEEKT